MTDNYKFRSVHLLVIINHHHHSTTEQRKITLSLLLLLAVVAVEQKMSSESTRTFFRSLHHHSLTIPVSHTKILPRPLSDFVSVSQIQDTRLMHLVEAELESNSDELLLGVLKIKLKSIQGTLLSPPTDTVLQIYEYSNRKTQV